MDIRLYALSTCPYCRRPRSTDEQVTYELTEVDLLRARRASRQP
jgi:glutaredoxin